MQAGCPDILKKLVPLSKVVNASIVDVYEDIGKVQQLHFHWAARGLKKLQRETLKSGRRNALITVNQNTRTASLPNDFEEELFVGYINDWGEKVPIPLNTSLINTNSITTIECEDTCPKCGQNSTVCNDLTVTESVDVVIVNDSPYDKTTIKKLYPDGSYYLETTVPYWDTVNEAIAYATTKEFIATIDLKDCGCINPTVENIETIRTNCYDCYACHYAPCSNVCDVETGGYKIFEEQGLIQFDYKFRHTQVYLEYRGFIPKMNGQLAVPEVAFETLVEYIKAMSLDGKRNVSNNDKVWRWNRYSIERKAMVKSMTRFSLDDIIYSINLTPKFDWTAPSWNNFCHLPASTTVEVTNATITNCEASPSCTTSSTGQVITPYQIAIKVPETTTVGLPIDGQSTYQSDVLKNALNLDYIILNNNNLSKLLNQFTLDTATGTIDISPNVWVSGDVLIAHFNKLV
jgi:hypothetical protein